MEALDDKNEKLQDRKAYVADSQDVEMTERLHVELFLQHGLLVNGVSVKIRLVRNNGAFAKCTSSTQPCSLMLPASTLSAMTNSKEQTKQDM